MKQPKLPEQFTDQSLTELCDTLGIVTTAGRNALRLKLENALLLDMKQRDYGPGNISAFGAFGCLVRMNDKLERLKTLFDSGRRKRATNESILDSFRDFSNYADIAFLVETNQWPSKE